MIRPGGFNLLPVVVKNLLILNGLFFLAKISLGELGINLDNLLAMHYYTSPLFKPFQIVTYLFMHADHWHLFFNMFALWMFGNSIENVWGPKRFAIYYLITGFGAAILHFGIIHFQILNMESSITVLKNSLEPHQLEIVINEGLDILREGKNYVNPEMADLNILRYNYEVYSNSIILGASGSVFGILLAFGMMFPNVELFLIFFPVPIKAKYFVAGYGAMELILGIVNNDNVAHFAHLGGMLFGYLLIKYWGKDRNSNNYYQQF